jgi:hypothetical protein
MKVLYCIIPFLQKLYKEQFEIMRLFATGYARQEGERPNKKLRASGWVGMIERKSLGRAPGVDGQQ